MDATVLQTILQEIQTTSSIGFAIVALLAALVCAVVFGAWLIARAISAQQHEFETPPSELGLFQNQVEDALEKGDIRRVQELVTTILNDYPMHVHATWYKAIAEFRAGAIHDSTRSFKRVLDLAPDWTYSVEPYLELLAEKARTARPRPVQEDEH